MPKTLVVFGATGQQGGSVIDFVLNDGELSKEYTIRGITRDTDSSRAQALKFKGVELVQADVEDIKTLEVALAGADVVFSNTSTVYDEKLFDREISSGKAIADASVKAGAQYIIYSSSTPAGKLTGRPVPAFDSKFEVEEYIRTLPIKSAFYVPGAFMQNYHNAQRPRPSGNPGEYILNNSVGPDVKIPTIEIVADTGKFVGAILADLDKYEGKNFYAASVMLSGQDLASALSKSTGKTVKYICHPEEVFKAFLPGPVQEPFAAMLAYMEKPGYYGPETAERVAWTQAQARGKLTTYEEFLKNKPLNLA